MCNPHLTPSPIPLPHQPRITPAPGGARPPVLWIVVPPTPSLAPPATRYTPLFSPQTSTPANLHLHPFKRPVVEHPGKGSCSTDPSFAPAYSTLQPAMQLNGRCSNARSGFHPWGCRIVGSLSAFQISHTHPHPSRHRCRGLCVFSAVI